MSLYVSVDGKQIGPFEEDAVLAHLASGMLSVSDMAIRQGDASWSRLGDIFANRLPVRSQVSAPRSMQTPQAFSLQRPAQPIGWVASMQLVTKVLGVVVLVLVILQIIIETISLLLPH